MAHFIGKLQGNRGEATRLGSKNSGIEVDADGWNFGVSAKIFYDKDTDQDVVRIFLTGGSNGGKVKHIGLFTKKDLESAE